MTADDFKLTRTYQTNTGKLTAHLTPLGMTVYYDPTKAKVLNITFAQLDKWRGGELIQRVMPDLTADEREFLMTGLTSEDWDLLFPDDEREDALEADEKDES